MLRLVPIPNYRQLAKERIVEFYQRREKKLSPDEEVKVGLATCREGLRTQHLEKVLKARHK